VHPPTLNAGINKAKKGGAPNTGISEEMNKKGWVDASGRKGKVPPAARHCRSVFTLQLRSSRYGHSSLAAYLRAPDPACATGSAPASQGAEHARQRGVGRIAKLQLYRRNVCYTLFRGRVEQPPLSSRRLPFLQGGGGTVRT
jgi:hypothetical protein